MSREGLSPGLGGTAVYLKAGNDLAMALARVEGAGAKVVLPKTFIKEGMGYFAVMIDSEGNSVGLHSPSQSALTTGSRRAAVPAPS